MEKRGIKLSSWKQKIKKPEKIKNERNPATSTSEFWVKVISLGTQPAQNVITRCYSQLANRLALFRTHTYTFTPRNRFLHSKVIALSVKAYLGHGWHLRQANIFALRHQGVILAMSLSRTGRDGRQMHTKCSENAWNASHPCHSRGTFLSLTLATLQTAHWLATLRYELTRDEVAG